MWLLHSAVNFISSFRNVNVTLIRKTFPYSGFKTHISEIVWEFLVESFFLLHDSTTTKLHECIYLVFGYLVLEDILKEDRHSSSPFSLQRIKRNSAAQSLRSVSMWVIRRTSLFLSVLPTSGLFVTSRRGGRTFARRHNMSETPEA